MFIFSKLGNNGRLGNQLFQIAATYAIAKDHNVKFGFPDWEYSKYFEHRLPPVTPGEFTELQEPQFHYGNLILDRSKNMDLLGFFQSEKYFEKYIEEICRLFAFKDEFLIQVAEKLQLPEAERKMGKPWCAISVRRGDYVGNSNYAQIDMSYYRDAICDIEKQLGLPRNEITYIVFSDDLAWCKESFNNPNFIFTDGFSDIESLALLSLCDHFIIANSTFAWWGAWLGEKEHSKIVVPNQWFGKGMMHKKTDDLIPERWKKQSVENAPIKIKDQVDLTDVTFTIPVKCEHNDRKENLEVIVCFLQKWFSCKIMVYEQDVSPKLDFMKAHCTYKFFPLQPGESMHRTKLLNLMARDVDTPIIFNYDTDVIFDPDQILDAVNKIRTGELDGCYPYDGRFVRLERSCIDIIRKSWTTDELQLIPLKPHEATDVSVGGAVAWNRDSFIAGGLENERMISFGPEDYERYDRFLKLGYKVGRITGKLFHIGHWVGQDSNTKNPHFDANEKEFEKIKAMSAQELKEYVNTWPWYHNKPTTTSDQDDLKPVGIVPPAASERSALLKLNFDQIYCVNLERRKDRKEHARKQFEKNNIMPVKLITAVDGKSENLKINVSTITPGMIGCFQSHRKLLKDAIDNNYDRILVFEDDLEIMPGFDYLIGLALESIPSDWQFVYLGWTEHGGFGSHKSKLNDFWVVPASVWGTQAYMINGKDAIKKIYDLMEVQHMQLDEQLTHKILPDSGLNYYAVFPALVGQAFNELGTDVQEREFRI